MKFFLLPSTKEDLKEIKQYISKENPTASKMVSERIKKALLMLTEQPLIGHVAGDEEGL